MLQSAFLTQARFPTWQPEFRHLNWTPGPRAGNGRLSQAGGSWVTIQCLSWNNQRGHRHGKQGVRPAGLTCPELLTPFPLLWRQSQTAACEVLRANPAHPELPRVYPKRIPRNVCRLVLPWTDWINPKIPLYFCCFLDHYSCTSSQPKSKLTPSAVQRWERKTLHCFSLWICQAPLHTCPSAFQTGFQVEIYLWWTGLIKIHPLLDCVVPFQRIHFMKHAWNQILSLQINKMVLTISFIYFTIYWNAESNSVLNEVWGRLNKKYLETETTFKIGKTMLCFWMGPACFFSLHPNYKL